ncbi:hypothetical protein ACFWOG_09950 [Kitasatospora sp. NPDC058406]|uniref:HAAS signaling domain-containing protein n=1 Tax=Kitasatospora sp. NPDC058406 TaxID=3346483 RepID=UPI003655624C
MNTPMEHPLVLAYLDEITRRTTALPAERRRELLADLREHVEVALAEHGHGDGPVDDGAVRQVLDRLGRPQEVAGAALAEEGQGRPEPESAVRTHLTLGLVLLSLPLLVVPAVGPVLATAAAVTALVRIWRSPQWDRREKRQATLLLLSPVLVTPLVAGALSMSSIGLGPLAVLAACLVGACLPGIAVIRLARSAALLRADTGRSGGGSSGSAVTV